VYEQARSRQVAALQPWLRPDEKWDYGKPAPAWLRDAEVYNLYYRNAAQWTDEVVSTKLKGFPLIVGSTPDPAALERCHRQGIKLLHYVVYTCLLDTALQVKEGGQVYSEWTESVDNESRDLKNHPDWVCLDKDGKAQHDAWGMEHGHKGLLNTCLHQRGLREAAVRQVRMLMERGYDGVFIDLAGPTVECYGDKLGKHQHEHPEWSNTQAYEELLKAIYGEVKRFGDDRIVMQNTCTGIIQSHWASCDSQMLEAVPYAAGSTALRMTAPELLWTTLRQADAVKAGKVPVILPYFGGVADLQAVKAAALNSYAWARVSGFLWADGFGLGDLKGLESFSRELYSKRTGKPTGPLTFDEHGLRRPFKDGLLRFDVPPN
ncbi:MAG: putative glycoside hydrolase, partial [Armatimonadota bacterium]